ncbi:MAG: bifunctional phosphoribosylaminoimidazolecarboxamide formyltransferase/IMP cyclohydrolase [Thermoproteota archaeon]
MTAKMAIISVSDKRGIVEFAKTLIEHDFGIISTGGTAKLLRSNGIVVKEVSEITGYPELFDGRVKTLHPLIYGGILADRDKPWHVRQLKEYNMPEINIVVVNLYPFRDSIRKGMTLKDIIENIDIGGPSLIRAAAKNYRSVSVVVDPSDYEKVMSEIKEFGQVSIRTREALAIKAFEYTSDYDYFIADYLGKTMAEPQKFPSTLRLRCEKVEALRYGENPHQLAALYKYEELIPDSVLAAKKIQGKDLSYNNINDLNSALELLREFEEKTIVIVKHSNPCGVACGASPLEAYSRAYESDPISAYGGIIGANFEIDVETAERITQTFYEAIIASGYEEEALKILGRKKNLMVLDLGKGTKIELRKGLEMRSVLGGILVQEIDTQSIDVSNLKPVTARKPTQDEIEDLIFAWKVAKHVKSNSIVIAKEKQTLGVGAGQMSRVDSARIAIAKAGKRAMGSCLASDGFIPFKDTVEEAARAGIKAIIQPGGSIRDQEVIQSASENNIAMVFTGIRCFRH